MSTFMNAAIHGSFWRAKMNFPKTSSTPESLKRKIESDKELRCEATQLNQVGGIGVGSSIPISMDSMAACISGAGCPIGSIDFWRKRFDVSCEM